MSDRLFSRRSALAGCASLITASRASLAQQLTTEQPGRIPPVEELVNAFEVELIAQRKLDTFTYAKIAGSDRKAFERITFRPRLMVDTTKLDLSIELFGDTMFTPILIGPTSQQKRFHPEGESAMARGAAAAKVGMVVASRSSQPIGEIAEQAKTTLWYQVDPEPDMNAVRSKIEAAAKSGCKAVCLTLGVPDMAGESGKTPPPQAVDWAAIDRLRRGITVPLLLKGIMSAEEARLAVQRGVQGIVVSSYRGPFNTGLAAPIEVLPGIAEAVGGKIPVLIDGSFRRGGDVLKALALGARAVLLGRPPLWGLAAYGADGVQHVLELIQGELARAMTMCGKVNLAAIDRSLVRIHRW
jgi:isopentenyl diphosphate isomerase/L-lactate dehydrogenase-like FMN-dependent dehydrogenase